LPERVRSVDPGGGVEARAGAQDEVGRGTRGPTNEPRRTRAAPRAHGSPRWNRGHPPGAADRLRGV